MLDQDKILEFLKVTGPTLPSKVAKNIGTDILIASAHLSDLSSRNKIKISKLKVGSSPLYYLAGQEEKLYSFAEDNLNPKDYAVLQKLRDDKVMQESKLDLLAKVALRQLQDFAIPLHVRVNGKVELVWKWFLLPDEESNQRIHELFSKEVPVETKVPEPEPKVAAPEPVKELPPEPIKVTGPEKIIKEEVIPESAEPVPEPIAELVKEEITPVVEAKEEKQEVLADVPEAPKKRGRKITVQDEFEPEVKEFLSNLDIVVEEVEVVRKNREIDLMVKVPSVVGHMRYFCKAKKKKRCDEKDLSSAYMESQIKKLPLLFIYADSLNKKAQEMLDTGAFENTVVKKMS